MKSLLATLPLALLGMACGQACRANTLSFDCCSPAINLPDVASFGTSGSSGTMTVPLSNPSDTAGLTAIGVLVGKGTIESQAKVTALNPNETIVETFGTVLFTSDVIGLTDATVGFSYATSKTTVTPTPIPAAVWLVLSGLGGLGLFSRKRVA